MSDSLIKPVVLSLDTAMGGCSVAVVDMQGGAVSFRSEAMDRGQSEVLVPFIQSVMHDAGFSMGDLGLVVTTIGPGGFTGLRIGLSTARSFGMALGIPVAGVRTTDILLQAARAGQDNPAAKIIAIIETKREDFYVQEEGGDPFLIGPVDFASVYAGMDIVLCGDGVGRLLSAQPMKNVIVAADVVLPDPRVLARRGWSDYAAGRAAPPEPLYLRGADVSVSKRVPRKIAE